ncbi:dihydrofolate reductase [Flavobacterium silvaticum]|uniref:Dihydrofolate reductase n=1 Tax=Flavobacterium silvaticum TaxID=1852020 RepID=A0A972JHJ8_9FLAO|nr:dihydrofolate reductase [Flavobacterium silvaticum]NMH27208.1 dihydrofolate reductase [Flavobacterium silvaticum]
MIVLIAAAAQNNALGKDNQLLWHLPDDFKRFKELTSGHYIIMGRKTFESFPKPLPNRTHVIITRQKGYNPEGCIVVHDMESALEVCPKDQAVYVIGGGEIYNLALPYADRIDLTRVHASFEADAFFPEFDPTQWKLVSSVPHEADERHAQSFTFETWDRM